MVRHAAILMPLAMETSSTQNATEILSATLLLNAVEDLLAKSAPAAVAGVQSDVCDMAAACGVDSISAPPVDWIALRSLLHDRASSQDGLQRLLFAGSTLLKKYPVNLMIWLRRTPGSFYPPIERLDLLLHLLPFSHSEDHAWLLTEAGKSLDRLRMCSDSPGWQAPRIEPANRSARLLTRSQQVAFDQLVILATLYFRGTGGSLAIKPRFNALLVAPTGSGKSMLAERVAKQMGACFTPISLAEWMPVGVRDQTPTLRRILRDLRDHDRVVVFMDEIDKLQDAAATPWTRSCMTEVHTLLDRRLPVAEFVAQEKLSAEDRARIEDRMQSGLWFVSAGTWQDAFTERHRPRMGFGDATRAQETSAPAAVHDGRVPLEIVGRCGGGRPIVLQYPDEAETDRLLRQLGLYDLASSVGRTLSPVDVRWTESGWRSLEVIAADLLVLRELRRVHLSQPVADHDKPQVAP